MKNKKKVFIKNLKIVIKIVQENNNNLENNKDEVEIEENEV